VCHFIVQGLRDWSYIQQCVRLGDVDPFDITSNTTIGEDWIRGTVDAIKADIQDERKRSNMARYTPESSIWNPKTKTAYLSDFFGGTRHRNETKLFLKRVLMALLGGVFLICPMIIMIFNPTLLGTLLTTCISVFLFGLTLSVVLENGFEILSGTAAYAAVLVVFVGSGSGVGIA
jgi:hypothetical protein